MSTGSRVFTKFIKWRLTALELRRQLPHEVKLLNVFFWIL